MRVLFVLHQYLPRHVTGTEQYARALALGLRAAGHDVHVLAYEPLMQHAAPGRPWFETEEVVEGVPVHRFGVHPEFTGSGELAEHDSPLVAGMFERWFAAQGFDLVHVFHLRLIGTAGITVPHRMGVPVVVHLMDFWFLCPNVLLLRRDGALCQGPPDGGFGCVPCMDPQLHSEVERLGLRPALAPLASSPSPAGAVSTTVAARAQALVARKPALFAALQLADLVVAPSRFVIAAFEAQGFAAGKIALLPYGLDRRRFAGMARAPRAAGADSLDVGYLGSITHHKGVHTAIEAVHGSARPGLRLHVRGDVDAVPEYGRQLRALAADDDRITYHGRFTGDQLGAVLANLDCVTVPSLWHENTPFAALEALQFGLPVVGSDRGGIAEVVQHEQNGLLFAAGDATALRVQLERLMDDGDLRARLSTATAVPDIADNVQWLLQRYAQLIDQAVVR